MDIKDFPRISEEKNLTAPCGIFCGACDLYRCATNGDTKEQERLAEFFRKRKGGGFTAERMA